MSFMQNTKHDEANHIKNYEGEAAIQKLKELAENARICMFVTLTTDRPLPSRPMAVQAVDNDGALYFYSVADSDKNHEIAVDSSVQLFFANNSNSEYLSIYGTASISQNREKIKELWTPWAKIWFQNGPDDPELTLISVKPESGYYWDTKHNKVVQLLKIATSIVSGKTLDDSVEGKLKV